MGTASSFTFCNKRFYRYDLILLMWQQIGYMMIIYIAGLNNVSPDLVEAAQIDGATATDRSCLRSRSR